MMKPLRFVVCCAAAALVLANAAFAERPLRADHEEKALEIFRRIIGMRTAEGYGEVPRMAEYLASELRGAGFADEDIHILPAGETAALVVRYRGDGSSGAKPVLFLAHMDVVDARREDWELDPFTLTEQDGFFFGRGTSDNKYGVMNLTQTFMRLKREGFTPDRDLVLVFTGDEETAMTTTKMLAYDRKDLTDAEFALNSDAGGGALDQDGRPLGYLVQAAEKTYATFEITARNPGGHSSRPRPDNAIYDLADAIKTVQEYSFPVMWNDITRANFAALGATLGGDLGRAMQAFADDPTNEEAADRIAAEPSYVGQTKTTCVATMLRAGHAENALPQSATATVNCRIFPGTSVAEVQATLARIIANDAIDITALGEPVESPVSELRADVLAALAAAVHERYPGLTIGAYMESGGTDGMHFRSAGVPTLAASAIFMNEDDMFAHGLNERIPVAAFYAGLDHWMIVIKTLAGGARAE